jgi:hypothetical protein
MLKIKENYKKNSEFFMGKINAGRPIKIYCTD